MVNKKYIKPIYPTTNQSGVNTGTSNSNNSNPNSNTTTLSSDEKEVFDLINQQRIANRFICFKT